MFKRKYIVKGSLFHGYVSLPECNHVSFEGGCKPLEATQPSNPQPLNPSQQAASGSHVDLEMFEESATGKRSP